MPLESLLLILRDLRSQPMGLLMAPQSKDAHEYGTIHGMLKMLDMVEEGVKNYVNEQNRHEDDQ